MSRRKRLIGSCIGILMMAVTVSVPADAQEISTYQVAKENVAAPREAQYRWIKKEINGKRYRRLWDATNKKWLTDWIPC